MLTFHGFLQIMKFISRNVNPKNFSQEGRIYLLQLRENKVKLVGESFRSEQNCKSFSVWRCLFMFAAYNQSLLFLTCILSYFITFFC